jgi:hypothetical protein
MLRFDLLDEYASVYAPSPRRAKPIRVTGTRRWALRIAPFAVIAIAVAALTSL